MSEAQKSVDRSGDKNPMTKKVFVYSKGSPPILFHEFISCTLAAKHFSCTTRVIS